MIQLKESVYKANMLLKEFDLVKFTWGNVSGIDREKGLVASEYKEKILRFSPFIRNRLTFMRLLHLFETV